MRQARVSRRDALGRLAAVPAAAALSAGARPVLADEAASPETVLVAGPPGPLLDRLVAAMRAAAPAGTTIEAADPGETAADLLYLDDQTLQGEAKAGRLRPLDDLWARHAAGLDLGDVAPAARRLLTAGGRLLAVPATLDAMLLFYRRDLLDEAGKAPPATIAAYRDLAAALNSPLRAGTTVAMRPVEPALGETHWYLGALGDGWFDERWRPAFAGPRAVGAIATLKEVASYAQPGFTSAAGEECVVAIQQDLAVMGLLWASQAPAMDDEAESSVAGKVAFAPPPEGRARVTAAGLALAAGSRRDPDLLFRLAAAAALAPGPMREAAADGLVVPPRLSLLRDPALVEVRRHYPAALAAADAGAPFPPLPEFLDIGGIIAPLVLKAVAGELEVEPALTRAAAAAGDYLRGRGYDL